MRWLLIVLALALAGSTWAVAITVCPSGCDYTTVQAAINAAVPGAVVEVQSGTYHENIAVNKSLSLEGKDTGSGMPLIDAGGSGSVVTFYNDNATLEGFNITGSGHCGCGNAGVKVLSNNDTVIGNIIHNNKYGIYENGYKGNKFLDNNLTDNNITVYALGLGEWQGNHYSDYQSPANGCEDANKDGICDRPYNVTPGPGNDSKPLASLMKKNIQLQAPLIQLLLNILK